MALFDFRNTSKITPPQIHYIECLLIDVGIGINFTARKHFVSSIVSRDIAYLDELTQNEASTLIDRLKELKEGNG